MSSTTAAPPIRPSDYLALDALLTDEERDIRDTVRAFVRNEVVPNVGDWFEAASVPLAELAPALGKLGVLGMHLQGYGCAGASATAYGLACMELEAGDSGIRSLVSVQGSLAMYAIWRWGSEDRLPFLILIPGHTRWTNSNNFLRAPRRCSRASKACCRPRRRMSTGNPRSP
ncbi:MAG TPA: acyl-CoA dehydrogenase family protein [Solirubrobacterales bacterium]|nr:acyl-CoA dehydrogenase family protein [Solirubrobacterales bacterium]